MVENRGQSPLPVPEEIVIDIPGYLQSVEDSRDAMR